MSALATGSKAPEFELPFHGGGQFSLYEALSTGSVALAFFKVSCPVCQYAFPFFDRMSKMLQSRGVTFIGVSQDDVKSTALFIKEFGITFPVVLDEEGYPVSNAFGLTNVPTLFLIGGSAVVENVMVGWSKQELQTIFDGYRDSANSQIVLFPPQEDVAEFKIG